MMDAKKFNKLIKQIGNSKVFNILYVALCPKIITHIFFKFRNSQIGEDVAQEFFTKLLKNKVEDYVENPIGWVYTVCDNIACTLLKSEKKYNLAYVKEEPRDDEPFEKMLFGEYHQIINELDETTREIIKKNYFEGYSLKEVAEIMNMNYNTVRQKCSRGLKLLKKSNKV